MNENFVSFKDYEGLGVTHAEYGAAPRQDIEELNKALTVGQDINNPGSSAGEGFPFRVESLEATLRVLTYKMEHLKFWKAIPKAAAYNTVEEHNTQSSYGTNPDSVWIDEGDLPEEEDSQYARNYAVVKYMGTTRKVSHVATMIKPAHGNLVAQETVNGTMHLLRSLESALFYGDSSLSALQFDGYEKLITDNSPAANIIDLRGAYLTEDILADTSLIIHDAPNYGTPTNLHLNPKTHADLCKTFFPKERHPTFTNSGTVGLNIPGFVSPAGPVTFDSNAFVTDGGTYNAAALGDSTKRPGTPTISTSIAAAGSAAPLWTADDAGDYYYQIVACNRYGKSAPVDANEGGGALTVAATNSVTFGVTPSSATTAWYEVYRTAKNGADGTERLIQRIVNSNGAGAQTITDLNARLPGTTSAFLLQQNVEALVFKQLAPMVKIPLATIDTSVRWAQVIYGVPVLAAPGKVVLIKNIGRLSSI